LAADKTGALGVSFLERCLRVFHFLEADQRALILKDMRVFWRDTTQWGQSLVLFGLLAAYVINLRHFSHQLTNPFWVDLVSYLNLGACSLNLATLTTRFVYPQFSLEGKRVWIVGMAPLGLTRVVITKFMMSTVASLVITVGLVLGSCYMLQLSMERTLFFSYAVLIMTLTLNGLAIGLGVLYPNFKEDNPSKIVSGFGGTFCLVLSFLYIVAALVALVIGAPWARAGTQPLGVLLTAWAAFAVLSMLIGWVPLKLALRRVRTIEL
jgi:ABC-2 type transport system permease protein